jgi:inhibitor of KinA
MRRRITQLFTSQREEKIIPMGDEAALGYCADEAAALGLCAHVRAAAPDWLVDAYSAYTTVAVYFNPDLVKFASVADWLRNLPTDLPVDISAPVHHVIPCCYELQLDFDRIETHTGLNHAHIIAQHLAVEYSVYAIGFCPGFPYLGYLADKLAGVPRLESPRMSLPSGSVGLTGRQTGIYTEARPGGWNIVGRTPLELVNVADEYFPIRAGDRVRFERIDEAEFQRRWGERLEVPERARLP